MRRTRLTPTRSSRHARRAGIFLVSTGLVIVWSLAGVRTLQAAAGGPGGMLSVHLSGGGSGSVTSVPAGIDCGPTCSSQFTPGTVVSLTAAPDGGSFFSHWSGACAGSGPVCTVTVDQNTSATANFALTPTPPHPTPASTPPTATPTPRPSPRPSSPGGTPPPTQPGTGGTGTSQSPGASSLATDSGGPSVNPDSSAPALGAIASPFDTGPSATPTVIAAGFGQGEAAMIVAVAAILTAIIIAIGIAVIAIADRRAREKRRVMQPRR